MLDCAGCAAKYCSRGGVNGEDENCPGKKHSPEEVLTMYSEEEKKDVYTSSLVVSRGYGKYTRVEETMDYCYNMGYTHLGLAFCVTLSREAETVARILKSNGFSVDSVCCKSCSSPKTAVGLTREQFADPRKEYESLCNPVGQALLLNESGCDFVLVLGLCVGHDTLLIKHLEIPCTVLAVKDRVLAHDPLGAVYTADSIYKRQYTFIKDHYGEEIPDAHTK